MIAVPNLNPMRICVSKKQSIDFIADFLKRKIQTLFTLFLLGMSLVGVAQQKYPETLTVSQDGKGDYKTIQEAVNSVRDLGKKAVKIFIRKGIYQEKLIIPSWKTNISLIGEDASNTIITNADYSGKVYSALSLSGLFEDFPFEKDKFNKTMNPVGAEKDTASAGNGEL